MDKFKKFLTIFICVILCIAFIGIWFIAGVTWFYYDARYVEHLPGEIITIQIERQNSGIESNQIAYSITELEDKITVTIYSSEDPIKTMYIYNLENDIVKSCTAEVHYSTKNGARNNTLDLTKKERKDNVITGIVSSDDIGKKSAEIIDKYNITLSHLVKVNEADLNK